MSDISPWMYFIYLLLRVRLMNLLPRLQENPSVKTKLMQVKRDVTNALLIGDENVIEEK